MKSKLILLLALSLVLLLTFEPQTAYANAVVGDGTPASCTETALRNAIAGGGTITFNCGPNDHVITIRQELFFQDDDVTLDGGDKITLKGTPGVHIIRFRTWGVDDVARTLTLQNMTIRDAYRSGNQRDANGAAVYVTNNSAAYPDDQPTLIVDNVTFVNNVSVQTNSGVAGYDYGGGAIMIWGGDLIVRNSTFIENRSEGGGGGAIHGLSSNITLENSTFTGNVSTVTSANSKNSGFGGAFYVDGARPGPDGQIRVLGSTFTGNVAGNRGGFAYIDLYRHRNESLVIAGSRFINNSARHQEIAWGGALVSNGIDTGEGSGRVDVTIVNSLFQGNIARGETRGGTAGAINLAGSYATIGNTTFIGNRAEGECDNCWNATGGAMFIPNVPSPVRIINSTIVESYAGWGPGAISGTDVVLTNSILANNTAFTLGRSNGKQQHCRDPLSGGSNNIQFPISDAETPCLPGITNVDPLLGSINGNALSILAGSPAINQGNSAACQAAPINGVDANGAARQQGACDIGAFEFTNGNTPPVITSPGNQTSTENETVDLLIEVIDPEGDAITLSADGLPNGLSVNGNRIVGTIGENTALNSPYLVTLTAADASGSTSLTFSWAIGWLAPEDEPERVSPADGQSLTGTAWPRFQFRPVEGITWYQVWVGTPDYRTAPLSEWYKAEDICTGDLCTVPVDVWLRNGDYEWWMTYWGPGLPRQIREYWNATTFSVNFAAPSESALEITTPMGTSAPQTITWSRDPNALWYQVWVGSADYTRTIYVDWNNAANICDATACTLDVSDLDFPVGVYEVWFEVWGPGGYLGWQDVPHGEFTVGGS